MVQRLTIACLFFYTLNKIKAMNPDQMEGGEKEAKKN